MNPVNVGNLGPSEVQSRIREIQAKLERIAPPKTEVTNYGAIEGSLAGAIGADNGFRPLSPMAPGVDVSVVGAPDDLQSMIAQTAARHGLDPAVFEALVWAESSFNPAAKSSKGAMGLTQLMPGTAKALGVTDPFDPAQNLDGGARYLSQMLKQFDGDIRKALAAYNAGPGNVRQYGGIPPFRETQDYVEKILNRAKPQP